MKTYGAVALLVASASATILNRANHHGATFGPHHCARVVKSASGACAISTRCEGLDTSRTEFAFDCVTRAGVMRHSYGFGGFDALEDFDTGVKCDKCAVAPVAKAVIKPVSHPLPVTKTAKRRKHKHHHGEERNQLPVHGVVRFKAKKLRANRHNSAGSSRFWPFTNGEEEKPKDAVKFGWPFANGEEEEKPKDAEKYGPKKCVSTWKNSKGECVIQTNCKHVDISYYEFGLKCVNKKGDGVVHKFGRHSFEPEEKFDTLIPCEKCLGLPDVHQQVASVRSEIADMTGALKDISKDLQKLNSAVFTKAPAPAPAASPASASDDEDEDEDEEDEKGEKGAAASYVQKTSGKDDDDNDDENEYDLEEQSLSVPEAAKPSPAKKSEDKADDDKDNEFDA